MVICELDSVVLRVDKPELGLAAFAQRNTRFEAGDVGTVVHVYGGGVGYEVEFATLTGHPQGVLTLAPEEVRAVEKSDLLKVFAYRRSSHVRRAEVA